MGIAAAGLLILRGRDLEFLHRYKYVLLGAGLALTALTLLLGTSPTGIGPRLWLGCCGLYFQPSEPLKLLLVIYLSAYLADHLPSRTRFFPLVMPTLFVTGLALALLIVQRDLGTASIFIVLYTTILYMSTGRRRVLLVAAVALALATTAGFSFVQIVHARLEAWINPWNDPSGRSYQIVQSLLSIANGGILGAGPGVGSPSLVPVAHSDFIFSAIAEETGLLGTVGLLIAYAILLSRGFTIAIRAQDRFLRLSERRAECVHRHTGIAHRGGRSAITSSNRRDAALCVLWRFIAADIRPGGCDAAHHQRCARPRALAA